MARRESLASAIDKAQARAVELDALIPDLLAKEKGAVAAAVASRTKTYTFGSAEKKARDGRLKAVEDREMLQIELDALAVERAREIAAEADEALAAAIKDMRTHRPSLERLYAEAGEQVAALAATWLKVRDEIEAFDGKVSAGSGLAGAAVTNLDARAQWNDAAFSLSDLGPMPVNVAYFVEVVLAASLDPAHDDEFRVNAMRADVGIPDLREFNVICNFSGDRLGKRGGSDFADKVQNIAVRNEPKPEPAPPTAEAIANAEALAAEQERLFAARRAHETNRRGYNGAKPVWASADPTGLGYSEAQQRELAELQSH
jgi:hypothetical protein